jgi:hypothetical protein
VYQHPKRMCTTAPNVHTYNVYVPGILHKTHTSVTLTLTLTLDLFQQPQVNK